MFASQLATENGTIFEIEEWQAVVLADIMGDVREALVLLPKGNGKTTLFSALALYHLLTTPDAKCYIAAASRDQATLMFDHARGFVERSDGIKQRLLVRKGSKEIRSRRDMGFIKVLASDVDTADGVGPTLALVDELHRHKNADLYGVFRDGLGKRSGQICTISTAGYDELSALAMMRHSALELENVVRDGSHTTARSADGMFAMHEWAVPEGADTSDLDVVKAANPSSFVTIESLRQRRDSPSMRENDWLRYACNQWTNADEAWLPAGAWDACMDRDASIPDGSPVYIGVDIGLKKDSSAVSVCWPDGERIVVQAQVFKPRGDGSAMDLAVVEHAIRGLADRFDVRAVVYDRWSFERSAQMLSDEGLLMLEFPMTNERTVPASTRLYEAIVDRRLVHDGDPVLSAHVAAGAIKETERGWRLAKGKARRPIDGLIALLVGFSQADIAGDQSFGVDWG
ncbi:MAG: terminase large subunit [Mycobacterium sp.]